MVCLPTYTQDGGAFMKMEYVAGYAHHIIAAFPVGVKRFFSMVYIGALLLFHPCVLTLFSACACVHAFLCVWRGGWVCGVHSAW